ncbi:hypothetical protein [Candidatus Chlamydia sanziniae]|uniref:Transmembrane protein n=1 Tax=Candidatus Chlamydia sanziniae TaxID=1806891 RepID=A0A1A9HY00_9CHLA|nr:hypothetical protein [Candidatus Chlamydia sanziniae]ANH78962.1 hypothetical protein Cs308_0792 [Candidatus Chlamydia sanziniae]
MKRKPWYKILAICLGLGLGTTVLIFLPALFSRSSGKYLLFTLIHKESGLTYKIEDLELSWLGPQKAQKIKILDSKNSEIFSAEKVQIDGSLIRLLLYKKPKGLTLYGWSLHIDESQSIGTSSIRHLDPGSFLPYLEGCDKILSEHGSINMRTIQGSHLAVSGFYLEKTLEKFIMKCAVTEENRVGSIFIESIFSPEVKISLEFSSVPISFFKIFTISPFWDQLFSYEDSLNLSAAVQHTPDGKIIMTAIGQGNQVQAKLQGHIHKSTFYIVEGSPSFIEIQSKMASALCTLLVPFPIAMTSQQIHVNISNAKIPLDIMKWRHIEITSQAFFPEVFLDPQDSNLSVQLTNLQIGMKKTKRFTDIRYSSSSILGGTTSSYLNGSVRIDNKKNFTEFRFQQAQLPHTYLRAFFPQPFTINLPLEAPNYSLHVEGKYKNNNFKADATLNNPSLQLACSLSGPYQTFAFEGHGTYHLTKKWEEKLSPHFSYAETQFSGKAQITQNHLFFPKFSGKIIAGENELLFHAKFGNPNEPIKPETTSILIHGNFVSFPLSLLSSHLTPFQVQKLTFSFHTDGGKFLTKGNLQALIENPTYPSLSSTRILIPNILFFSDDASESTKFKNLRIQCSGEILSFPLDALPTIYEKNIALSNYFGPTGNFTFSANYNPKDEEQLVCLCTLKSDALLSDLKLVMDSSMKLSSATEGVLQWEISPERYVSFFKEASCFPTCTLHRTAVLHLNISKLSCANQDSGLTCLALLAKGGLEGSLTTNPLIFYDHISKETFIINNLTGSLYANNLSAELEYNLEGCCLAHGQDPKSPATFLLQGKVNRFFNPELREFKQTTDWKQIPSAFITGIVPISPAVKAQISSLAGPKINVRIKNDLFNGIGPIHILVDAENLQAQIPLILTDKAILLDDNLKAHLNINEAVNRAFLQEFNPLISGSAYSQYPITLEVEKQNFYLPIKPYSFEEFRIDAATLDIGKISIANTGTMNALFQFLDIEQEKQFVESWFTPIFFSVQKGTIFCKRFDALIDNRIRLALWGKTDIMHNKIYMTLGIDPEVIKKYFHNTSLKTKNFFLIRIRGPISSPEVDWSSAYARIALLKSYNLGNPFNSLADKLFSSLGDATPPQTVHPLPWEKSHTSSLKEKN